MDLPVGLELFLPILVIFFELLKLGRH
jgi:hypothetical protein